MAVAESVAALVRWVVAPATELEKVAVLVRSAVALVMVRVAALEELGESKSDSKETV